MRILQFYQHNGKLKLPWWKQGNYPVIPIYAVHVLRPQNNESVELDLNKIGDIC